MSERLLVVAWGANGCRVARASWHAGVLRDVTIETPRAIGAVEPGVRIGVVLPPWAAARRLLELPVRSERALAEMVPLEMQGRLPVDPGPSRVVWSVLERHAKRTQVAAILVSEAELQARLAPLVAAGASATRVDVAPLPAWQLVSDPSDTVLVIVDDDVASVSASIEGQPVLARTLGTTASDPAALAAEVAQSCTTWEIAPRRILVGGRAGTLRVRAALETACRVAVGPLSAPQIEPTPVEDDPVVAGALLALGRAARLPLALVDAPAVPRRQRRRLAALAAAAALLVATNGLLLRSTLVRRAARLEAATAAVAAAALPEAGPSGMARPHARLLEAVGALREPAGEPALARLEELGTRVPAGLDVDLERLHLDDDEIVIAGDTETFEAAETLRRALAGSPRLRRVTIDEMQARIDGDGVSFVLRATWLAPGERAS